MIAFELTHKQKQLRDMARWFAREQVRTADHLVRLDLHHLMRERLDVDALIDAGDAALMRIAPDLLRR